MIRVSLCSEVISSDVVASWVLFSLLVQAVMKNKVNNKGSVRSISDSFPRVATKEWATTKYMPTIHTRTEDIE